MKRLSLLVLLALLVAVTPAAFAQGFTLFQPTGQNLIRDLSTDFTVIQWTPLAGATSYTLSVFQVSTNPGSANARGIGTAFSHTFNTTACSEAICTYLPTGSDHATMTRGEFAWTVVATTGSGSVEASNAPLYFSYEPNPIALVPNSGFDSGELAPWKQSNPTGDKLKAGAGTGGSTAYLFKGSAGENSSIKQKIDPLYYAIDNGDSLTFSADYTAKGAPNGRFIVNIKYKKSSGLPPTKVVIPISFNATYTSVSQVIPVTGPVNKVIVTLTNNSTSGKWTVDNVQVVLN